MPVSIYDLTQFREALKNKNVNQANILADNIWKNLSSHSNEEQLEILSCIGKEYWVSDYKNLALQWYEKICIWATLCNPMSVACAWDYYFYADCLAFTGDRKMACENLKNANTHMIIAMALGNRDVNLMQSIIELRDKLNCSLSAK